MTSTTLLLLFPEDFFRALPSSNKSLTAECRRAFGEERVLPSIRRDVDAGVDEEADDSSRLLVEPKALGLSSGT